MTYKKTIPLALALLSAFPSVPTLHATTETAKKTLVVATAVIAATTRPRSKSCGDIAKEIQTPSIEEKTVQNMPQKPSYEELQSEIKELREELVLLKKLLKEKEERRHFWEINHHKQDLYRQRSEVKRLKLETKVALQKYQIEELQEKLKTEDQKKQLFSFKLW